MSDEKTQYSLKRGTITLYYNDEVISVCRYWGKERRNYLIEKWKRQYGERISCCVIGILPDIKPEEQSNRRKKAVNIDGYFDIGSKENWLV